MCLCVKYQVGDWRDLSLVQGEIGPICCTLEGLHALRYKTLYSIYNGSS